MRGYGHPSFSSTLLDSIYRSIDDEPSNLTRGAPDSRKKQTDCSNSKWGPQTAANRPRTHLRSAAAATSSSSSDSSYGGFSSSSELESVRLKPIRTTDKIRPAHNPLHPPPLPPGPKNRKEKVKKNLSSIRSKLRSPASPAARLAGFLNSLFTHHHKPRPGGGGGTGPGEESASSTASSFSKSCMSTKMTSAASSCNGSERSVTFRLPVDGGGRKARERKAAEEEWKRERERVMTWRGFEEGEEEDDVGSESSSDLFELENLSVIGRYRDELPVYRSTNLGRLVL